MNGHRHLNWLVSSLAIATFATSAAALPTSEVPKSAPEYIAKTKTAAPASIVNGATIVMMQEKGDPKVLQAGSNGFTCLVSPDGTPLCADANAMEWRKSVGGKTGAARQDRLHLHDGGRRRDQQSRSPCDRQEPLGADRTARYDRRRSRASDGRYVPAQHGPGSYAGLRHVSGHTVRASDAAGGCSVGGMRQLVNSATKSACPWGLGAELHLAEGGGAGGHGIRCDMVGES